MQSEVTITVPATPVPRNHDLAALVRTINDSKQNIAQNFLVIGHALAQIRDQDLYREMGFNSFNQFLTDQRVDISPRDAERFIAITEDPHFQRHTRLGLSKIMELLKLEPATRERLLSRGAEINGTVKQIDQMNLSEMKRATSEIRREGKVRCDRCGRWVDQVKELDGRFYGSGGAHSCYEYEMEERRTLSAGRIPAAQLDTVLDTLKTKVAKDVKDDAVALEWLPESFYQLYGQILQEQSSLSGEITPDGLKKEKDMLQKLIHLCQTRLHDIQDTMMLLKEMDTAS